MDQQSRFKVRGRECPVVRKFARGGTRNDRRFGFLGFDAICPHRRDGNHSCRGSGSGCISWEGSGHQFGVGVSHTKIIESCVFILLPIIIIPISRKKTSSPTSKHLLRASLANDQRKIIQIDTRQLLKDPTTSINTILKSIETMDTQRGML